MTRTPVPHHPGTTPPARPAGRGGAGRLIGLTAIATAFLLHTLHRAGAWLTAPGQDDEGLSAPEVAALTVLGLVLAGALGIAARAYVNHQTSQFK
ncbi:MAG: hypothetical protein ACQSGP_03740 [Frankia sp.]